MAGRGITKFHCLFFFLFLFLFFFFFFEIRDRLIEFDKVWPPQKMWLCRVATYTVGSLDQTGWLVSKHLLLPRCLDTNHKMISNTNRVRSRVRGDHRIPAQ